MSTSKRLIEFVLNEQPDKFKTVLKEQITDRMVDSIYRLSLQERKDLFKNTIQLDNKPELQETKRANRDQNTLTRSRTYASKEL